LLQMFFLRQHAFGNDQSRLLVLAHKARTIFNARRT
jgi:hypothetical protein